MEPKNTPRITKGLIVAIILIVLDLVLQKTYNAVPDGVRYLPRLAITFLGVLISCLLFVRQSGGQAVRGEVFSYGFRTTAFIAFAMAFYTFIAIKFIYPPPDAAEMDAAVKAIEQQGNALHEEAKQLAKKAAENRWIIYVSLSIFASLIPGLLASLAGAATAGKKK